jgi:DNA-binding transcriptional LysR family regulator
MSIISQSNIRDIDLNLLIALDVLLDERNVTRAAERLSYSQPAVSGMLKRLRAVFGDPLFVRTQRGLSPTPRALELAGPVKSALAELDAVFAPPVFDPKKASTVFSIAATDYAQHAVLAPMVARLRHEAPDVRFAIGPADAKSIAEQLETQAIDFAITIPEMAPPHAVSREIFRERYVCAVRKDHPSVGEAITVDEFCAFDHILVSPGGNSFQGPADTALKALGRRRRVVMSVPNFLILPKMLLAENLMALIPERLVLDYRDRLKVLPVPFEMPGFSMIAAWHERTRHSPAHRWFRELMIATAAAASA